MVADYFTKALQCAQFRKMCDMIMGNTDIPLPSEMTMDTPDPSAVGIHDGTLQESRSVLKDEIALTVLPAFGTKARQSVPAGTDTKKSMASKRTLSWAQIVKK
jgi:hypothetical protein